MRTENKKQKSRLWPYGTLLMAGAMMLSGCSGDDDPGLDTADRVAVQFTTQMPAQKTPAPGAKTPVSRTTTGANGETQWVQGDRVGIFMLTAGGMLPGDIVGNGTANAADNREYSVADAAAGTLAPVTEDIYYPQTGTVDFVGYYPYRTTPTADPYIYKVSVADQNAPANIDILYAKTSDVGKSNTAVGLAFDHVLSKLVVNVKAGNGMGVEDFSGITASLQGFPTTADLALADGTVAAMGGTTTDIAALKWATASDTQYKATFEAIIIPQSGGGAGRSVVFTVNGLDYTWPVANTESFGAGNAHIYEITVNKTGVAIASNLTITLWTGTGTTTPGTAKLPPLETVKIKAGTFMMGSPDDEIGHNDDETQHAVTLTGDFWMSKYQVTNAQYAAFLNANNIGSDGKWASGRYPDEQLIRASSGTSYDWGLHHTDKWEPASGCENHPVIFVTWYGAAEYAHWIGGSLPTEAQWEYACRAGSTKEYGMGYDTQITSANLGDYAWYAGNNGSPASGAYGTKAVGLKKSNAYGLYDMHGNVNEWCSDWYDADYYNEQSAGTDPIGPTMGDYRVLRGVNWIDSGRGCRSAFRKCYAPGSAYNDCGFRVVFVP